MTVEFKDDIEIKVEINRAEGTIRLSDSINKAVVNFMNTKEKAVRDALISLGWTPPPDFGPLPGPKLRTRSPIAMKVKSLKINESFTVATQAEAHRWRVYISREYGAGSGAYRAIDGHYRVWRMM